MGRNAKKEEGVIKRGKCQIFVREKVLLKSLKFYLTYIKSQSSFQGQVEECNSLFFIFLTIILKSHVLICRFFDFILVSKLLNLNLFADIARLLVLKTDQIDKAFMFLFSQYDLAQVVNCISQIGLNIDFPVAFSGC